MTAAFTLVCLWWWLRLRQGDKHHKRGGEETRGEKREKRERELISPYYIMRGAR